MSSATKVVGEASIAELLAIGRARFPEVAVSETAFVRHLERHLAGGPVDSERAADLYLVAGCLEQDRTALAKLDAAFIVPVVARVASRYRIEAPELGQHVREHLLLPRPGDAPKLASYAGRGPLEGWLRIVAVRLTLTRLRKQSDGAQIDIDEAVGEVFTDDIELSYVRTAHAADFKLSFHEALASLSSQDATILGLYVVEDLSIDDIGRLYNVHRATAARWVVQIRATLFSETRRRLAARLALEEHEFESLVGMILSRLEVSLIRVLAVKDDEQAS